MATLNPRKERLIYNHEDPAKKLARFAWWHDARQANPSLFYKKNHFVLAGYGGDISVLMGMGVEPDAIIAADENRKCIRVCRQRFQGVQYMLGTITPKHPTGFMLFEDGSFATAMLDFCGAPVRSNLEVLKAATKLVDPKGTIGCTFLTSRGSPELKATTKKLHGDVAMMAHIIRHAYSSEVEQNSMLGVTLRAHVTALMMSPDWFPQAIYTYKSHQEKVTHTLFTMMFRKKRVKKVAFHNVEATEEAIKAAILENDERPVFDAALMMNVPRMTVAGWKAHATRKREKR